MIFLELDNDVGGIVMDMEILAEVVQRVAHILGIANQIEHRAEDADALVQTKL
ncbi:hypothetical protein D3C75_1326350 [compost metagenome]